MPASAAPVVAVASEMGWYSARSASERAAAVGESPYSQSAVELGSLFVGGTAASGCSYGLRIDGFAGAIGRLTTILLGFLLGDVLPSVDLEVLIV